MQPHLERDDFKHCTGCGQRLASEAPFCDACGTPAQQPCPHCGSLNAANARFCAACGQRSFATTPEDEAAGARAPLSHRRSAPKSLLEERKLVTIMFVDMIDSLAAIRDADPEEAHELISLAISVMTSAIHDYDGTVIRNTGDGVLAVFGAPVAQEDHAQRSCHAALSVLERLREARKKSRILDVRIGLHSGEVTVGTATNDFSIDYEATGAAVHIAARLQNQAPAGRAVMSATTMALANEAFDADSLGMIPLKGLEEPMELFVLNGSRDARPLADRSPQNLFVGRDGVIAQLQAAFDSALRGQGRVVLLTGEAGIGKTTLIEHLLEQRPGAFRLARSSADRYRGAIPFHPLRNLLLELFDLVQADDAERSAAITALTESSEGTEPYLRAALLELFETGETSPEWNALVPQTRNQLLTHAILRELRRASERQPLVLIIEDLQRTDSCSIELLGKLIRDIGDQSILVLLSCRPEFHHEWAPFDDFEEIRLSRLSQAETEHLTKLLLGAAATPALQDQLMSWSLGNPLFLRETVRMLIDSNVLGQSLNDLGLQGEAAEIASPASIRALIAERIDRLPTDAKELLLAASVLGEDFGSDILAKIAAKPEMVVTTQLGDLAQSEFVERTQDRGSNNFAFCHPLFQEVCYATLLKQKRATLHAAAFSAIDESVSGDSVPPIEKLALHAYKGRLWRDAVRFCRSAGQRAASRSASREAANHLRKAVTALGHLPSQEASLEDAIDVRLALRTALIQLLELSAAETLVKEAHDLAGELGDKTRLAQVVGLLGVHDYLQRGPARALELSRQSIAIARTTEDDSLLIAPNIYLAQCYYGLGQYRETIAVLERTLPIIDSSAVLSPLGLPGRPLIMAWYWIAISKAELGRFDEAETLARKLSAEAAEMQVFDAIYANTALGFVRMTRGDYGAALEVSNKALAIADRNDLPYLTPVLASQVGWLLAKTGKLEDGLRLARHAVRTTSDIGVFAGRSRWCARLAEVCLLAGELEDARQNLETALEVAERAGELGYLCSALQLRATVAIQTGADLTAARDDLANAMLIARRLGLVPSFAKCLYSLATLDERRGHHASAGRKRDRALAWFRRYGMRSWVQAIEEDRVPAQ